MRVTGIHRVCWEDMRRTLADKPTIVFVQGAFRDALTWDPVAKRGHCSGEIILVGHSYGGALITRS